MYALFLDDGSFKIQISMSDNHIEIVIISFKFRIAKFAFEITAIFMNANGRLRNILTQIL